MKIFLLGRAQELGNVRNFHKQMNGIVHVQCEYVGYECVWLLHIMFCYVFNMQFPHFMLEVNMLQVIIAN